MAQRYGIGSAITHTHTHTHTHRVLYTLNVVSIKVYTIGEVYIVFV